jgi:hypothetical protein
MDRWDVVGASGALVAGAGLWGRWGWPWAAMFWGALLLALYILREVRR